MVLSFSENFMFHFIAQMTSKGNLNNDNITKPVSMTVNIIASEDRYYMELD